MTTEIQKLEADYAAQAARIEQLTAENFKQNEFIAQRCYVFDGNQSDVSDAYLCATADMPETPATDAALREIQAQGIKYARNRLIASFTHGFLDKPESEVRDICQMLDDAASELKNEATDDWVSETFGDEFLAAPLGVQQ